MNIFLQWFESYVMVELAAVAPYVVGKVKKSTFLKINIFTIHIFLWRQFCGIKNGINEFYNISWPLGRYKTLGTGGKWTKEQVKQQCVTFALIAIVNKGSELYIYTYILYNLIKRNNFSLKYLQFYWLLNTFRRWRYCMLYGYLAPFVTSQHCIVY